jgi:hypothetical protein
MKITFKLYATLSDYLPAEAFRRRFDLYFQKGGG